MGQSEIQDARQPAPAADASHSWGEVWSKVKSTTSTVADGAVKLGQKVVEATPGVVQEGVDKAKSLDTAHNRAIAQEAGKAGAKAAIFGPHAAVLAAGASVLEQTTGHKVPFNPMNAKQEIARRVIDSATDAATGHDAPHVSHLTKLADNSLSNPFKASDLPSENAIPDKRADISPTGLLKGIKDTASKYLPHTAIDGTEATQMKH